SRRWPPSGLRRGRRVAGRRSRASGSLRQDCVDEALLVVLVTTEEGAEGDQTVREQPLEVRDIALGEHAAEQAEDGVDDAVVRLLLVVLGDEAGVEQC